ncbi:MAG: DinB family protein [Chloroflexi bacterium]|nr:DinB family protein [Chloroflexota bacterium]
MTTAARIERLERSVNQLIQEIERLPAEVLYRAPGPGEWPVMSTLAHLSELLPYWAHQAEAISRQPGQPFGRTHADADRIGAVEEHGHDSLDVAVNRIRASLRECVNALSALPVDAWASAGQHPTRGMMTITQLVDAFLVSHVEEHTTQTRATLATLKTGSA